MGLFDKIKKMFTKEEKEPRVEEKELKIKEDLEDVQVYIPFIEKTPKEKVNSLKAQLTASDYKIIKCIESYLAGEALPYDINELHAERDSKRAEINRLEEAE